MFSKVIEENRPFELMLKNSIIKHEKKRDILEKVFWRVHPVTM
jgi:F-type H+-transporting ATPase subunit delta